MNRLVNERCRVCDHFKYLHEGVGCVVVRCDCKGWVGHRAARTPIASRYRVRFDTRQYPRARVTSKEHLDRDESVRRYDSI